MSTPSSDEPKIVSYNIPRIEVYQVTDDELRRMEEAASNVGNEFATMLATVSVTVSLVTALTQGEFETDIEIAFKTAIGISTLISVCMGVKWYRHRSLVSKLMSNIRSRRTEPDT